MCEDLKGLENLDYDPFGDDSDDDIDLGQFIFLCSNCQKLIFIFAGS